MTGGIFCKYPARIDLGFQCAGGSFGASIVDSIMSAN